MAKQPTPKLSAAWPAANVQMWALSKIKPYDKNPRTHSDEQVALLARLMLRNGVDQPIVVDEAGVILKGHGRRLAALRAGFTEFPVAIHQGLSDTEKRAMRVADNQVALLSGWDETMLKATIKELNAEGFELANLGFNESAITNYLGSTKPTKGSPDDAPPLPVVPVSALGDLWVLGDHRLICGDSTDADTVARLLGGKEPGLMVTDPPYGVSYDPSWRVEAGVSGEAATGKVKNDDRVDWRRAWQLFPGSVCYVWHGGLHSGPVQQSLMDSRFIPRAQIVWVKTRPVLSRGAYHWQHEPAIYAVKEGEETPLVIVADHEIATYAVEEGEKAQWEGGRKQSTVWTIEHIKSETGHGTQKPMECMRRPIENNSKPGDMVYDPFVGSGTTLMAAELTKRRCFAVELDPKYVDVIVTRWQSFTQKTATLESGKTFEQVKKERADAPRDTGEPVRGKRKVAAQ